MSKPATPCNPTSDRPSPCGGHTSKTCGWQTRFRLALVTFLLFACGRASMAARVDATYAQQAVRGWLTYDARPLATDLGATVAGVETFADDQGQPLYYIVYLDPSGLVIVPADDEVEPIIGFAEGNTYDPSPGNPFAALIQSDLPARIAMARQGLEPAAQAAGDARNDKPRGLAEHKAKWKQLADQAEAAGAASISDVCVAPLTQSKWSQGSVAGDYCYDYYTPNHYITGCVATALAQLIRYHQHPGGGIGAHSFTIAVDGVSQTAYTRGGDGSGGAYDWSQMVLVPGSGMTTTQRQAIGALCADTGTTVGMSYAAGASSASTAACKTALVNTFGYASAIRTAYGSYSGTSLNTILNSNLDAAFPCQLAISTGSTGHSVVADGYGYDLSTTYHHLNMGWSGSDDAWYNLPTINSYNTVTAVVYNVYPTGTGEIISGRIMDSNANPLSGVLVTAQRSSGGTYTAMTNAKGIYALAKVPSGSSYALAAVKAGYDFAGMAITTGTSTDGGPCGNIWGANFTSDIGPAGDINGDGYVNVGDLQLLVAAWGSSSTTGGTWSSAADLNTDNFVNIGDLQILVANWGKFL